jgi:hypothetical protein
LYFVDKSKAGEGERLRIAAEEGKISAIYDHFELPNENYQYVCNYCPG